MSFLYSRALVAEYSEAICSDGEPSAPLSVMPTPHKFWHNGKTMEPCQLSRFGLTLEVLTEPFGEALLMWFLEGFRARTFPAPEKVPDSMANALDSGRTWPALLAKYDPDTHSLKTAQSLLLADSTGCFVTLPRWGSMRNGELLERATLARRTSEKESGSLLPTPSGCRSGKNHVVGRMDEWGGEFKPMAWNGYWQDELSRLRGMGNGLARAVDRTDAIRNGQVPAVAAAAFRILSGLY